VQTHAHENRGWTRASAELPLALALPLDVSQAEDEFLYLVEWRKSRIQQRLCLPYLVPKPALFAEVFSQFGAVVARQGVAAAERP